MERDTHLAGGQVTVSLTAEEALVLFDVLSRWKEVDTPQILLEHQAEYRVLWDICATLESALVEPFMPSYRELVSKARAAIGSNEE